MIGDSLRPTPTSKKSNEQSKKDSKFLRFATPCIILTTPRHKPDERFAKTVHFFGKTKDHPAKKRRDDRLPRSSTDSGLEAFSHNPTDGSFACVSRGLFLGSSGSHEQDPANPVLEDLADQRPGAPVSQPALCRSYPSPRAETGRTAQLAVVRQQLRAQRCRWLLWFCSLVFTSL